MNTNIALHIHKVATPQILFKSGTAILGMSLPGLLPLVYNVKILIEFLHCTPVGSKPGSDMPNMVVPDLNKI